MDRRLVFSQAKYVDEGGALHKATRKAAVLAEKRHCDWIADALYDALPESLQAQVDAFDAKEVASCKK